MGRARLAAGAAELKTSGIETLPASQTSLPRRDGLPLAVFLALTCVMTNPLVLHIASAVEDKQDALLNTWIIGWVGHALVTDPLNLFNANIFYPYPNTLAFSETMLPQGLFALPFNLAFDNTVLGYNLVLLASFFFAAYAMYLFIFDLTRSRGAAMVAGTIFAFNPYNLGNLAQVQLLSLGWLPLALMYLRRMLAKPKVGSQKAKVVSLDLLLFVLFFSLQALSSFYFAFLAGFAAMLYVVWWFIANRSYPRLSALIRVLVSFVIIAVLVVPFLLPYFQVQRDLGFQHKIEDSEPFSASLKLYTEVSPQNVLYGNLLAPRPPVIIGGYPLDNLFPGVIAVVLAMVGLVAAKNRERWFYFLLLAFAFLLSFGPRLFIAPNAGTGITLPYRWLYDAFPLMRAFRAPVRFDALVMFALAVLAGFGVQKAESTKQKATDSFLPTAFRLLPPILVPLIALEYLALPAANIAPVPTGDAIPQYVRWLAKQPPGVVLELPMIASDPTKPLDLTTQYLSTYHWHPTPDGYSGFVPPRRGEIAYEMQFFPIERSIRLLQALDAHYVIVHGNRFEDWATYRQFLVPDSELQLVQRYGDDYIYQVIPRSADASGLSASIYLPNPAAPGQNYDAYLIIQNSSRSFAIKPTDMLRVAAHWSDGTVQQTTADLPLVTSHISVAPIRLLAPSHTGRYQLDLSLSGRATGSWNLSGDVQIENAVPARQVVIPARVSLNLHFGLNATYAPGEVVATTLYWEPLNKINAYYSVSVRVVDANGNKVVNVDREPAKRTMLWVPDTIVPDQFALQLPFDLKPGEYSVQLLMYQADQGIDVLLLDNRSMPQEKITLGTFTVK